MKTGYFDTPEVSGFTWRTHWEEKNGAVAVTRLQLRSKTFTGPTWYPKGNISVNGIQLLTMDYASPATHAFSLYSAGESFIDIEVLSGQALPVSTGVIASGKAVITVNVELYRNSSTAKPVLTGSAEIPLTTGLVQIRTASGAKRHRAYVKQGGKNVPLAALANDGGRIKYCT